MTQDDLNNLSAEEMEQLGMDVAEQAAEPDDSEDLRPDDEEESSAEKAKPEVNDENKQKDDKKVNLGALHEERARRKAAEAERQTWIERNTLLEKRLNLILEKTLQSDESAPKEPEDPAPDLETDPYGYIKWQQRQIDKLGNVQKQTTQQQQEQQQVQQVIQRGTSLAMEYRQQNPEEYDAALNFLISTRANQLKALGWDAPRVEATINQEMTRGMIQALQNNQNPGEYLMRYAKGSGFVFNKPQSKDPVTDLGEKIAKNKSLGNSPKHGSGVDVTATDIADMSDEEFEKFYNKVGKKGFAKAAFS